MILSAHQPCYLPWLGFFNKICNADIFVLLDDVQFEKGSYINRTKIKTAQGEHWLTIPVPRDSYKKVILQVENIENFWEQHISTISHNYKRAPFYDSVIWSFDGLFQWAKLPDILYFNYDYLCRILGLDVIYKTLNLSEIAVEGDKQDLVLNLCKHYNADAFLFGAKGRDYVDVEYFKSQGVEPLFQDFKCIEYPQQWGGGFIPGLSIIDALFNVGPEKTMELIKGGYSVR